MFCTRNMLVAVAGVAAGMVATAQAAVVVSYESSSGFTPDALPSNPWTLFGSPMTISGGALLQDNTADDPATTSGEYLSPSVPNLMKLASGQYGIEVRVKPLTDVPFLGGSHYANAYVFWSDDTFSYNITIDKYSDDVSGTGGVKYGQNSLSDAVTGIDWSTPHTIFLGYTGVAPFGSFDVYVDGVLASTVSAGSIARSGGFPFAQNAVDFGDGVTGLGLDVAAEWYSVKLYDTATPPPIPEPTSLALAGSNGIMLRRRRR